MDASFWRKKWAENDIAFHEQHENALLKNYFQQLGLPLAARIFLPLCGKTKDIAWLLNAGYSIVGAELSELAIKQLFEELGVEPFIVINNNFKLYRAQRISIFVGDIFDLSAQLLGPIDALYDRAALVALPAEVRARYAMHVVTITAAAPQLLICIEYDQQIMAGPPFSVEEPEVRRLYSSTYDLHSIEHKQISGRLKGKCPAWEVLWLLKGKENRDRLKYANRRSEQKCPAM